MVFFYESSFRENPNRKKTKMDFTRHCSALIATAKEKKLTIEHHSDILSDIFFESHSYKNEETRREVVDCVFCGVALLQPYTSARSLGKLLNLFFIFIF